MNFDDWWKEDSGWGNSEAGLYETSEYQLAKAAYNAAIDEAVKVIEDKTNDTFWTQYLKELK